jgi:hypothetical protein
MVFCSTHKSLTLGMPILRLLYANDTILPYISLPLLCWHPMQVRNVGKSLRDMTFFSVPAFPAPIAAAL